MAQDPKKEAERLRKANYRAKLKSKTDGSYVPTPIEQAKDLLELMEEPDANVPFNDEKIGPLLKAEDKRALQNYVYNLKLRVKKED